MDMEDCKEMIEIRPPPANSGGGIAACPASPAPSSLAASYHHSQQAQPQQTHHQNTHSHTPPLNPHQLPHAHQHFNYPLMRTHGPGADDVSMPCTGKEHRTYNDDIFMRSAGKEQNTCTNGASTRSTNTVHLHQTNNGDARFPSYSYPAYSSMHISEATRPNTEPTLGMSAAGMGAAMHCQETHGIIVNPSISDASTTTPPQSSGTPQMSYPPMNMPLPDSFKKKRGRARKCSVDGDFSVFASGPLSMATKTGHHYRARGQMSALDQGLRPHIIAIARGEDVSARITSFQQEGNWGICVLSALGSISNVTLRHSETSSGTVTYEGCYDILSLSGSLSPIDNEGSQNRGGLIVSLAGLDGRVIGGEVTGIFVAASPIKVVIGTFLSGAHLSEMQGQNISQAETAAGSPSCATLPLQLTYTLDRRFGSAVGDSQQYQRPSHMVTSHFVDREGTGNVVDA